MSRDDYHDHLQRDAQGEEYSAANRADVRYRSRQRSDRGSPGVDSGWYGYSERRLGEERHDGPRRRSSEAFSNGYDSGGGTGGGARRRPPRGNPRRALITIAIFGAVAFAAGFIAMWSLGAVIVGGSPFGGSKTAELTVAALPVQSDSSVQPLVDLVEFRDMAYVPVKAVSVMPTRSTDYFDRVIAAIDRTEINSLVITVKDDRGHLAFDTDLGLGQKYGTINSSPGIGIGDLDALMDKLAEHHIVPIARIVSFKDDLLARKRPEMSVVDSSGDLFVDGEGQAWLNPYNHDAWEYLVQVAEECARRGFREIQFDYVRFPSAGTKGAVYRGQYCAKEDAIAGFLAYARPRLEALGVWMSADVFGWVVGKSDDMGIGQKLEKLCQNSDILCPMVYPSLYGSWSYGVDKPEERPYDIVHSALTDAADRLVGTGAKGRPYLLAANGKTVKSTAEWVKAQIQAAEDMGFNEWMLWGGYIEEALRTADGIYNGPELSTYGPGGTTGVAGSTGSTSTTVTE